MTDLTKELIQQKLDSTLIGTRVGARWSATGDVSDALEGLISDYMNTIGISTDWRTPHIMVASPRVDTKASLVYIKYRDYCLYTIRYKFEYKYFQTYGSKRAYKSFDVIQCKLNENDPSEDTFATIKLIDKRIADAEDKEARKKAQAFIDIERIAKLLGLGPKTYDFQEYLKYLSSKCYDYRQKQRLGA